MKKNKENIPNNRTVPFLFIITTFAIMAIIITHVIGCAIGAKEDLNKRSTEEMKYNVTETKRTDRSLVIHIPGFHKMGKDENIDAIYWMLCRCDELAKEGGFKYLTIVYPKGLSDNFLVGFPLTPDEDIVKTLGPEFAEAMKPFQEVQQLDAICKKKQELIAFTKGYFKPADKPVVIPQDTITGFNDGRWIDNDRFIIAFSLKDQTKGAAIYDVNQNKFSLVSYKFNGQEILSFAYSRDGRKIVFAAPDAYKQNNIYLMNRDGSAVRQLTGLRDDADKAGKQVSCGQASFSPDGKRVIFDKIQIELTKLILKREERAHNIFEIDLATGVERQLTHGIMEDVPRGKRHGTGPAKDYFTFGSLSAPCYFADGKRFIFYYPNAEKLLIGATSNTAGWDNYMLEEVLTEYKRTLNPVIADDDSILFSARTNLAANGITSIDGSKYPKNDLFLHQKGKTTRLTRLDAYQIIHSLSPNGKRAAFTTYSDETREKKLWVINTDTTGLREIEVPWDQLRNDSLNKTYSAAINATFIK